MRLEDVFTCVGACVPTRGLCIVLAPSQRLGSPPECWVCSSLACDSIIL